MADQSVPSSPGMLKMRTKGPAYEKAVAGLSPATKARLDAFIEDYALGIEAYNKNRQDAGGKSIDPPQNLPVFIFMVEHGWHKII